MPGHAFYTFLYQPKSAERIEKKTPVRRPIQLIRNAMHAIQAERQLKNVVKIQLKALLRKNKNSLQSSK